MGFTQENIFLEFNSYKHRKKLFQIIIICLKCIIVNLAVPYFYGVSREIRINFKIKMNIMKLRKNTEL